MARRQEVDLTALGFNSSADGHSHASRPVLVFKKKLGMNSATRTKNSVEKDLVLLIAVVLFNMIGVDSCVF